MHKLRDAPGDLEEGLSRQLEAIARGRMVYVLGLGNTDRADDGAGVIVAERLKKDFPSFSFSEHDGVEGTVLDISEKGGDAVVFFVDAANLNLAPGEIRVVRRERINDREITTHRVAVALMAAVLDKAGIDSAVICIQPRATEFRGAVSEPVTQAIRTVESALKSLLAKRNA